MYNSYCKWSLVLSSLEKKTERNATLPDCVYLLRKATEVVDR